jgi:hypothetical protein
MKSILLIIVLAFTVPVLSQQKVENGWKGLLPYKSAKADVEKALGKGQKVTDITERLWNNEFRYDTSEAMVDVDYIRSSCEKESNDPRSFHAHDMAAETVAKYWVTLKSRTPLSEFSFETARFARHPGKASDGEFNYYQAREKLNVVPNEWGVTWGIYFEGFRSGDREYIDRFYYGIPWTEWTKPCPPSQASNSLIPSTPVF